MSRFLIVALFICSMTLAQKGTITGVLTDKDANNATLPFANAMIKGTNIGTTTDENGKYTINTDAGNYTIVFSFLGYENLEVPVTVVAGETVTVNKALGSGSYKLEDVKVTAAPVSREKESALLLDQKNAVEIKQTIGAQELARKGVSDVATALTKTTGITKQEGSGNIYVRGLGDRYNATTMNGLPIPSNDPEEKNINLEIFTTDIVEYISIDKVYGSKLFGDFAGGNVDIVSKEYKGKGMFRVDIGSNVNTNAVQNKNFKLLEGVNSFGFSEREIPENPLLKYGYKTLKQEEKMPYAGNIGISAGDSYNIGENGKLSLFATAAHTNEFLSKEEGTAASGVNATATGADSESGLFGRKFFKYTAFEFNTNSTGMANISYKINNANKISINSLYINSSNQSTEDYFGRIVDAADDGDGFVRRSTYEKNTLFINQLLGKHKLSDRTSFDWGVSHNTVDAVMPDRATNQFNFTDDGNFFINSQSQPNNNRYFQNLKETESAITAAVDYKFSKTGEGEYNGKITLGYNGRFKQRDFEATQFNFDSLNVPADPENLESFYNQQNLDAGLFVIKTFRGGFNVPTALNPQTYNGDQMINSGYANIEYKFGTKFTAVLGLRADNIYQKVNWDTQTDPIDLNIPNDNESELEKTAFLPSLILKYSLNDKQNLRLGFSKTYTLPQFKERALFVYEDVTEVHVGNPDLYSSDNYNFDLKWEYFPKSDELISLTALGKYIMNPINEVTIASATNDISYLNTGDTGYVVGAEFEFRKSILNAEESANKLTAGINASYIYTEQELDSEKVKEENNTIDYEAVFTNEKGQFTGASPLLLNGDVTFVRQWNRNESNVSGTIACTYFSDRVYSIGTTQRGDLVDKEVGTLDFILKSKFNKNMGMGISLKNILNPTIERVQENKGGDVSVLSYNKGMNISLGINYQF